jgi:hypothetical protein
MARVFHCYAPDITHVTHVLSVTSRLLFKTRYNTNTMTHLFYAFLETKYTRAMFKPAFGQFFQYIQTHTNPQHAFL